MAGAPRDLAGHGVDGGSGRVGYGLDEGEVAGDEVALVDAAELRLLGRAPLLRPGAAGAEAAPARGIDG